MTLRPHALTIPMLLEQTLFWEEGEQGTHLYRDVVAICKSRGCHVRGMTDALSQSLHRAFCLLDVAHGMAYFGHVQKHIFQGVRVEAHQLRRLRESTHYLLHQP